MTMWRLGSVEGAFGGCCFFLGPAVPRKDQRTVCNSSRLQELATNAPVSATAALFGIIRRYLGMRLPLFAAVLIAECWPLKPGIERPHWNRWH